MLALMLAATLSAAPAPRAASGADTVVHVPRLGGLTGLSAFLHRAGQQAAMLRPEAWYAELHPFLYLDPSRPETLTAAGIDVTGPLTVSIREDGRLSCVRLKDAEAFQAKAAAALAPGGEVKPVRKGKVTTVSLQRESGSRAGYALAGEEACAFSSTGGGFVDDGRGEVLRKEAVRLVSRSPSADARLDTLPGALFIVQREPATVLGVDGSATGLRLEGSATGLPLPPFQEAGNSPYGAMTPVGLLFSRARVAPAGLGQAVAMVRSRVQEACPACPPAVLGTVTREVSSLLTGQVLVQVEDVRVRGSLRNADDRFFAARQALAAEVTDPAAAKAALAPLAKLPGAKALEDGYAVDLKGRSVLVRLKGRELVLANDASVAQALMDALPGQGSGRLTHAVDFTVSPKRVARALSQVSIFDVTANKQLAGLFAVGVELGPLLNRSERITGWLDSAPGNAHRFSLEWTLPAAP